jgi:hypothetical protein
MTTNDTRRRPLQGKVDFTLMYAVHDAFHRDLRYLIAAVEAGQTGDPDPLLAQVDTSLAASGHAGLADNAAALAQTLVAHMKHEEDQALPLVEAHLGPAGWAAFRKATGKIQGLRGGAEFFPWMLDGASADTSKRVLSTLPPPARLLYRAVWRPRYARTPRWNTTTTRTTIERPGS